MTQLLQNAATGTVLILATVLLRLVLKSKLTPGVWLALWAVCLFRLLTPVAPESVLSVYAQPQRLAYEAVRGQTAPALSSQGDAADLAAMLPDGPGASPGPSSPGDPPAVFDSSALNGRTVPAAVWLSGSVLMVLWNVLAWRSARRSVRRAPLLPHSDPRYNSLPRGVRLREGLVEGAPLTLGVLRPTVVLAPGLSGAALACVLAHEGVHARRRDNLWHYVTAIALTVFWWDPAVWLMAKLLRRDIELSCDRAALRRLGPDLRRDYAETLLSMSTQAEGPVFSQPFGQKQAEERILAVMKYKKMSIFSVILALTLVCGVTVAFATNPITEDGPAQAENAPAADPVAEGSPAQTGFVFARVEENIPCGLHIPTQEEVKQNGYPVNENGETYGPNINDDAYSVMMPDLLLAIGQETGTVGYVRRSEYPLDPHVNNPEEAVAYMEHRDDWESHTDADHYANLYLQDGVTVVGRFIVNHNCGCDVMQNRNK